MARHLRLEFAGAMYHVTSRGVERRDIFDDPRDCGRLVVKLAESVAHYGVRLYAYALMSNHYHLLVETPRGNLAAFMQQLNTSYTTYYNVRHQRVGHLFSGRYKAPVVQGDVYLLRLTRYIHLNPVKIKSWRDRPVGERLAQLRVYPWSSHRGYAGLEGRADWVDYAPMEQLVAQGRGPAARAYVDFVEAGVAADDTELQEVRAQSSKAIGERRFCRQVECELKQRRARLGAEVDAAMRRVEVGLEPVAVIAAICAACGTDASSLKRRRSLEPVRLLAARLLRDETHLTQRAIARELGLRDGSGLGRLLRHTATRLKTDRRLRRLYNAVSKQLAVNH